jgi:hypothetical protein
MINNDDEYAFPLKDPISSDIFGMTLRDYFAAKAMQGCLSAFKHWPYDHELNKVSDIAYKQADAMLKRRKS